MGEQQDDSIIIENFSNFLSANGKRKTPERFKILDRVLEFKKQFTIEDLKIAMLDENFPVSQSTLYYTMDLLVDAKILHKIKLVKDTGFMAYMNARKFAAFTSSYYTLNIYGICNDCARKIKRERMNKKNKSKKVT